ncbi:putative short-chain dehydrogenase/reductase family protein [Corynespora cassiicola Philippines]|uniref:Putative short-chain dehydrogenase/reductase family protein n=1 Tax=Corynespora cassiicola Philippines TaxID=1448308 RepID=A0A2T2NM11_CORCC|nr:putative short-chain dehydrogenase/reductase family protein [Corynespora cassiicola Philippines]
MGFYYSQLFVTPQLPSTSFEGQTVIVTGSNVGLGFEAARHFVRLDASKVILAVRNLEAGTAAKHSIESSTNRPRTCEVWPLDLSSFASVKSFAERATKTLPRLDILVENAAIANPDTFALAEGHERHITVNVLSTILLALLLLPKLRATKHQFVDANPHLTLVTSEMHATSSFPERNAPSILSALNDPEKTNMKERYATSKLLEILLVRELAPKMAEMGVVLNMTNPGLCHSQLARDYGWAFWMYKLVFARSAEVGSRTLVSAAAAGRESHGRYLTDGVVWEGGLGAFVKSEEGEEVQGRVWGEVKGVLERVVEGCCGVVGREI